MGLLDRTTGSIARDGAKLENQTAGRTISCLIEAISPDNTRARVRVPYPGMKYDESIEVRVILSPAFYAPVNVSNYTGILHGDPKSPIGVQLVPKSTPRPNLKHGISTGLFGPTGTVTTTPVTGRSPVQTDNIQQYINEQNYPQDQAIIIKPTKPISDDFMGPNPMIPENTNNLIDVESAYISVDENEVRLVADQNNGMVLNNQQGMTILGNVNIGSSIQNVRLGGAWIFNPCMQYQIPSTAISPVPTLVYSPPGTNITQNLGTLITALNLL